MRSTILAVILIVAAGAAHARPIPGLAGNAGRMPETMSPGLQPPPSMPTPTPVQPIQRYSSPEPYSGAMQYTSPSQSYDMPTRMGEPSGKRNVPREKVSGLISFWAAIRGDRPAAMRGFSSRAREVSCAC